MSDFFNIGNLLLFQRLSWNGILCFAILMPLIVLKPDLDMYTKLWKFKVLEHNTLRFILETFQRLIPVKCYRKV